MLLTADRFEQIVATLKADAARLTDKRLAPRVGLRMQMEIIACAGEKAGRRYVVWLRNLSSEGMGFVNSQAIPIGTLLVACLARGRYEVLRILYQVVHCTRLADGQHTVGAKLLRILGPTSAAAAPKPANQSSAKARARA
ncbi:MAG TPA: hypothetical protein VNL70_03715 [Tepidisphaeraceae bacterium]|nr:hypothetical protein [Tepidisphaeraceae bacterium]